jgi:hypothetical protein
LLLLLLLFVQVSRNCVLQPVLDAALKAYREADKGKKDAIVEASNGSALGALVAADQIGLKEDDWQLAVQVLNFRSPFSFFLLFLSRTH